MAEIDSLHSSIPNNQIHNPKDFDTAQKASQLTKMEQGNLLWEAMTSFPAALDFVLASDSPPTEVNGDIYVIVDSSVPDAGWDGAAENDWVRYDSSADTWFVLTPADGVDCYDKTAGALKTFDTEWTIGGANQPQVLEKTLTITTAQILLLNTTPIEIVPAPGVGFAIEVVSWSVRALPDAGFVAYATNTNLQLITDTAVDNQGTEGRLLLSTVVRNLRGTIAGGGASTTNEQVIDNEGLNVSVATGDPTTGTFDIKVYLQYRIIKL